MVQEKLVLGCAKCFKPQASNEIPGIDVKVCRGCQIDVERVVGFLKFHGLDVMELVRLDEDRRADAETVDALTEDTQQAAQIVKDQLKRNPPTPRRSKKAQSAADMH